MAVGTGILLVIERLGVGLAQAEADVARLSAENMQLKAQIASGQPAESQEGSQ